MKLSQILNERSGGSWEEPEEEDFSDFETESIDVIVPWSVDSDNGFVDCTIKVIAELEIIPPKMSKGQHIKLSRAINSAEGYKGDYPEPTKELKATQLVSATLQDGTILSANEVKQKYPGEFEAPDIYAATAEFLHRSHIIELSTN